jgi:hypothetical protein
MQHLVAGGDCSRLNPAQKVAYYQARCEAAGLDPRAQPFAFMRLNGKEVLYAQKAASDQLAAKHGVKMTIVSQATEDGIRVVTVRAEARDGRVTEEIGALPVKGLVGENLSNAMMKCVTKAKRRAILSLCGLGMLDEMEVESVPSAQPVAAPVVEVLPPAGERPAPREEAPKAVEAPKTKAPPPPYVMALFNRVLAAERDNKKLAQARFTKAAEAVFGEKPKPSNEWTAEDAKAVESHIWPTDIDF